MYFFVFTLSAQWTTMHTKNIYMFHEFYVLLRFVHASTIKKETLILLLYLFLLYYRYEVSRDVKH